MFSQTRNLLRLVRGPETVCVYDPEYRKGLEIPAEEMTFSNQKLPCLLGLSTLLFTRSYSRINIAKACNAFYCEPEGQIYSHWSALLIFSHPYGHLFSSVFRHPYGRILSSFPSLTVKRLN
ncbi:hypothetical protein K435DRAFT_849192 [Dendrothele bispora CBS 962.96]|uniref:Uncharacterized protein n=1 Tax=Dendrothele bispora (strain CBS 962.96) TaxID=1314807 RepID=A0A4S8MTZ8_DENBC|nr:hypothetical protein K435DRAFT_849192 [Dendrothele bispora CBS 962.96]